MYGIAAKLPLKYSTQDGPYGLTKTVGENTKQNLKNLILTAPGERVMMPDFGVGIHQYMFEQINALTFENITERIHSQVRQYLPYVNIQSVIFQTSDNDADLAFNEVGIGIEYSIPGANNEDTLRITVEQNYL